MLIQNGNPQEGITTEIFTEPENTSIPPENITVALDYLKKEKYRKMGSS